MFKKILALGLMSCCALQAVNEQFIFNQLSQSGNKELIDAHSTQKFPIPNDALDLINYLMFRTPFSIEAKFTIESEIDKIEDFNYKMYALSRASVDACDKMRLEVIVPLLYRLSQDSNTPFETKSRFLCLACLNATFVNADSKINRELLVPALIKLFKQESEEFWARAEALFYACYASPANIRQHLLPQFKKLSEQPNLTPKEKLILRQISTGEIFNHGDILNRNENPDNLWQIACGKIVLPKKENRLIELLFAMKENAALRMPRWMRKLYRKVRDLHDFSPTPQ